MPFTNSGRRSVAGAGLALLVFPLRFLYSMGIGVSIVALMAAAFIVLANIVVDILYSVIDPRVRLS